MDLDTIYGPPKFPRMDVNDVMMIQESATRSSIQYHTIQGYISENRIIQYLAQLPQISDVKKIPDYSVGHGGDIQFTYNQQRYTMEIKTATVQPNGKATLSLAPTRKSDIVCAYRRGDFHLVGICLTNRLAGVPLFVHTNSIPSHKTQSDFLATRLTLKESLQFQPFTHDLISLL